MSKEKEITCATKPNGYLCLVLHAHLPYVRHPEKDYIMEENWFYEALTETYIPLLLMFRNLRDDNVPFKLTMSLTPPLCAMINDELLQERYSRHLRKLISLAKKEIIRTRDDPQLNQIAEFYLDKFNLTYHLYENRFGRNLLKEFREAQELGFLETITCAATHGYLPNMQFNVNAVRAQIRLGVESHTQNLGTAPKGIWLPECGYYPGLEEILHQEGLGFFFMETHGLLLGKPRPSYGVFAPVYCKDAPVAAFGRDVESSRSVWSADQGYPGHPSYRDFYKDIGYTLEMDYIAPYIDPAGIRIQTGIKYHRVTDRQSEEKEPYNRLEALRTASEHAGNFMHNREQQILHLNEVMDRPPIISSLYDAELFGHWWYEGPEWLNYLFRKSCFEQNTYQLITPSEYLSLYPENDTIEPSFSSWGEGGYSYVWLNETNSWIYRHIHRMENRMVESARKFAGASGMERRILNQMARELLLSQSSDWAFIMKTGTMVEYAIRRTKEHISNFLKLYDLLNKESRDVAFLSLVESRNNIFPDIDFTIYC
ncbi:Glycogen branching enzyme, GH57-type [Chitinispirillum alkaliphilum]|nr:Glycogen branching enzyme, GH57-type [Chitinispirillum alkaliphilum]